MDECGLWTSQSVYERSTSPFTIISRDWLALGGALQGQQGTRCQNLRNTENKKLGQYGVGGGHLGAEGTEYHSPLFMEHLFRPGSLIH